MCVCDAWPQRPVEDVRPPGAGFSGSVGTEKWIPDLCKSSKHSYPNHLSNPPWHTSTQVSKMIQLTSYGRHNVLLFPLYYIGLYFNGRKKQITTWLRRPWSSVETPSMLFQAQKVAGIFQNQSGRNVNVSVPFHLDARQCVCYLFVIILHHWSATILQIKWQRYRRKLLTRSI